MLSGRLWGILFSSLKLQLAVTDPNFKLNTLQVILRLNTCPDFAVLGARLPAGANVRQSANASSLQNGKILKIFRLDFRTYFTV